MSESTQNLLRRLESLSGVRPELEKILRELITRPAGGAMTGAEIVRAMHDFAASGGIKRMDSFFFDNFSTGGFTPGADVILGCKALYCSPVDYDPENGRGYLFHPDTCTIFSYLPSAEYGNGNVPGLQLPLQYQQVPVGRGPEAVEFFDLVSLELMGQILVKDVDYTATWGEGNLLVTIINEASPFFSLNAEGTANFYFGEEVQSSNGPHFKMLQDGNGAVMNGPGQFIIAPVDESFLDFTHLHLSCLYFPNGGETYSGDFGVGSFIVNDEARTPKAYYP